MKIVKASVFCNEKGSFEAEVTLQSNGVSHLGKGFDSVAHGAIEIAMRQANLLFLNPLLKSIKITTSVEF